MGIGRPQSVYKTDIASLPSTAAIRRERVWLVTDAGSGMLAYWDGSAWVYFGKLLEDADGDTKIQVEESADEDKIRFDTGGTERAIIDNAGSVGIGTSSPLAKLHVESGGVAVTPIGGADDLMIENTGAATGMTLAADDDKNSQVVFASPSRTLGAFLRWKYSDAEMKLSTSSAGGKLTFQTDVASTAMTIDSSQRVGLGTASPNAVALLDVSSTTHGFLPPRMTTTQRDAISTPPAGLMIYNTTTNKLNFYNGSAWEAVTSA